MKTFATAIAAVGLALVASTPAFANKAGGPDTQNPVPEIAVAVQQADAAPVQVWAGQVRVTQPAQYADAVTGAGSDPTQVYHLGRLTWRVVPGTGGNTTDIEYASIPATVAIN